jgi:hypothetical protein
MNFINNLLNKKIIAFSLFTFFIFICKFYFLFIKKAPDGSNLYLANAWVFFNLKAFLFNPSFFIDWNHPGTPIYYLAYFFDFLFPSLPFSKYNEYLLIQHFFIFLLYTLSFYHFFTTLKKTLEIKTLAVVLFIFFSFSSSLQSLEFVDIHSFQAPLVLFCITSILAVLLENKIFYKSIFFCSFFLMLSISVKLSMFPLFLAAYVAITYNFFLIKKKIFTKYFFFFNFFLFAFFFIFNLPILGRTPIILYNVIFSRSDTSFDLFEIFSLIGVLVKFIYSENLFLIFELIFLFFITAYFFIFKNILSFKFNEKINLPNSVSIFAVMLFVFFIYVFLAAAADISNYKSNTIVRGVFFRNSYFYIIFLVPMIIANLKIKSFLSKNYFIFFSIFIFLSSFINYIIDRSNYLFQLERKNKIFYSYVSNNTAKESFVAVFNNNYGYGFADENIYFRSNNYLVNDKFASELMAQFPRTRYLRLHDIMNEIKPELLINKKEYTQKYLQKTLINWDLFLEKNLYRSVYKILSHRSLELSGNVPINTRNRSSNLFVKADDEKINYIIFSNSPLFEQFGVTPVEFIDFLKSRIDVSSFKKFYIDNDVWYLVKL